MWVSFWMVENMKNAYRVLPLVMLCSLLTGCTTSSETDIGLWLLYVVTAVFALLILVGSFFIKGQRSPWLTLLFASVLVVNTGYLLLSASNSVDIALHANRLAYLGSVFLPLSMLMIIMNASGLRHPKWLPGALIAVSILVFFVTATPGYLDIYYKEVSIEKVHGITILHKIYGPLHSSYTFFLLAYFGAMTAIIFYAITKRRIVTPTYSALLLSAVFINIIVWLIEKLVDIDFELLSISYIMTELFLLGLNLLVAENKNTAPPQVVNVAPEVTSTPAPVISAEDQAQLAHFVSALPLLTQKELAIFECYTKGMSTVEITEQLQITENTLKFHNKNIYNKLGVANRRQLVALYKLSVSVTPQ